MQANFKPNDIEDVNTRTTTDNHEIVGTLKDGSEVILATVSKQFPAMFAAHIAEQFLVLSAVPAN